MEKIILDTNFLMIPGQFKVDIFEELKDSELHTTEGVLKELEELTKQGKTKDRKAARIALELIKAKTLKIITFERSTNVDDSLIELSKKGYLIATVDKELQKKLKSYIYLRQKKYVRTKCFTKQK